MSVERSFSAPSKALLAGGYLVLIPEYSAFVTALSARMRAVVRAEPSEVTKITVRSPQFTDSTWTYVVKDDDVSKRFKPEQISESSSSSFIETTLKVVLAYVRPEAPVDIDITVLSDGAYHSSENAITTVSEFAFPFFDSPITKVPKTGLGSSAGLVTVLVASLLSVFQDDFDVSDIPTLRIVHNLGQLAHCAAQGKIGSGFDVGAAVFGSIRYRRFPISTIAPLIPIDTVSADTAKLDEVINTVWDMEIETCSLPRGIRLIMGDVKGGSVTTKLVSTVLNWRSECPEEAHRLWTELNKWNMKLVELLNEMKKLDVSSPEEYEEMLHYLSKHSGQYVSMVAQLPVSSHAGYVHILSEVVQCFDNIRRGLREMTRASGAEIEPPEQTILLNSCLSLRGVLGGCVPGAGGYDAICLLVAESNVEYVKSATKEIYDDANGIFGGVVNPKVYKNVTWLELSEESQGLKEEDPAIYNEVLSYLNCKDSKEDGEDNQSN